MSGLRGIGKTSVLDLDTVFANFPVARSIYIFVHQKSAKLKYDAWAAIDPGASPYLSDEFLRVPAKRRDAAQAEALSFAAYRVLSHRFAHSPGAEDSLNSFDALMDRLGYDRSFTSIVGNSPAAIGNRIAQTVIMFGLEDGSNEGANYADTSGYAPVNPPMDVLQPGLVVGQMKKTDREKDWPIVYALGWQAVAAGDVRGILHGQEADWLTEVWSNIPQNRRDGLIRQRPLLALIDKQPSRMRRAIAIEKQLWTSINRERHGVYQRSWKEFYRQWRREPDFDWPPDTTFLKQHKVLEQAARRHGLPEAPLDDSVREAALEKALSDAAEIFAASDEELAQVAPPWEVLLP